MRNITLIIGLLLLVANLIFGAVLACYPSFNIWLNSGIIALTTLLQYIVGRCGLKDAFYISSLSVISVLGTIAFALGLFAPSQMENNWLMLGIVSAILLEIAFVTIVTITSKANDNM